MIIKIGKKIAHNYFILKIFCFKLFRAQFYKLKKIITLDLNNLKIILLFELTIEIFFHLFTLKITCAVHLNDDDDNINPLF